MKTLVAFLFTILFYGGFIVSCIWAIVEFILYLVKDNPFNWWSVWCIPISLFLVFVSYVVATVLKENDEDMIPKRAAQSFAEKLRKLQEERSQKTNY